MMRPVAPTWLLALLLTFIPLLSVANYFAYHAPGAIGSSIQEYFGLDDEDLASMFTVYSAPNIILVFVGGILIDKYGLIRTSLVFNLFMLIGMIIFASAPRSGSGTMACLLIGRFLLGVGGECICVCASAMVARWFKNSSLTFAMGFNSALVQLLGSAPAFVLLPYLLGDAGMNRHTPGLDDSGANSTEPATSGQADPTTIGNVRLCLWVIVIVCAISFVANVVYSILDLQYGFLYVASELEEEFSREMDAEIFRLESSRATTESNASPPQRSRSTKEGKYSIVHSSDVTPIHVRETNANVIHDTPEGANGSSGTRENGAGDHHPATPHAQSPGGAIGQEHNNLLGGLANLRSLWEHTISDGSSSSLSLRKPWIAVKSLPTLFWLALIMQVLLSPILYSFSAFGPLFFMEKYDYTQEESGFLTSILYIAIILAPLFGYGIDKIGYRCIIQTLASLMIPIMFLLLHLTTNVSPYIIMCGLGVAFAVTESNGLAMIAEVAPNELVGTAYGILGCVTSFFLLFEPYIVGYLHLHTHHYYWSTVLFIVVSFLGWFASFVVYVYDVNHEKLLSESTWRKHESETSLEQSEQNAAYPELEIVFDKDTEEVDEDGDEVQLFSLDDVEALESLP